MMQKQNFKNKHAINFQNDIFILKKIFKESKILKEKQYSPKM